MNEDTRPLMVTIQCITYNHEPYIRQCLEGFVMQKTNFRFEAIVHDDASTDGTADIVKEYAEKYPDIIKPIFETENQYSKHDGSLERIMDAHTHGKYVAFCEGDDYWTDPLKLQMQINFMEQNNDYVLCFTDVQNYIEKKSCYGLKQKKIYGKANTKIEGGGKKAFLSILLKKCNIQTLSVVVRKDVLIKKEPDSLNFMMGDIPLWLHCSLVGKLKYFEECTGVYRINEGSTSRNPSTTRQFRFSMFEMRLFYCMKYGIEIPQIIKAKYNKALLLLIINGDSIGREPLYAPFAMNRFQTMIYNVAVRHRKVFSFIKMMWFIEENIQRTKRLIERFYNTL